MNTNKLTYSLAGKMWRNRVEVSEKTLLSVLFRLKNPEAKSFISSKQGYGEFLRYSRYFWAGVDPKLFSLPLPKKVGIAPLVDENREVVGYGIPVKIPEEIQDDIKRNAHTRVRDIGKSDFARVPKGYNKKLEKIIEQMAKSDPLSVDGLSVFSKAEMEARHEFATEMVKTLKKAGVRWAWTSSHADASDRCAPYQGKLFNLFAPYPTGNGAKMARKKDGHDVYCFRYVENKLDRWGYKNNIINGFNCRHYLIPYSPNKRVPKQYTPEEMERANKLHATALKMEKAIREQRKKDILSGITRDSPKTKAMIKRYKEWCKQNDYPFDMDRLGGYW